MAGLLYAALTVFILCGVLDLLYRLLKMLSCIFYINSIHTSSSMEKPSRGGEKRSASWASHPEERRSEDIVAPSVCDQWGVPHRWVGLHRGAPSGAAVDTSHDAAARVRGKPRHNLRSISASLS